MLNKKNQGTRQRIRALARTNAAYRDLFHPDYHRRPRHLTGSARPRGNKGHRERSRALVRTALAFRTNTAGGELHPALRTLPRNSGALIVERVSGLAIGAIGARA